MDIFSLLRALWRFKITSLLIIVLTVVAAAAMVKTTPPSFTGTSSYLLVAPPGPPTDAQLKADPALRRAHYDNPFVRYGNTGVIVDVVAQAVSSQEEQQAVVAAGGDPNYTVSQRTQLGINSPIIDITVNTTSQAKVDKTLDLVSSAVLKTLHDVQANEHVDAKWTFTTRLIDRPAAATRIYSGTIRALVGVVGAGGIVLVVALALRMTTSSARERKTHTSAALRAAQAPADDDSEPTKPAARRDAASLARVRTG